ncbi:MULTISPECIES: NigD-like protein [Petrimonas]|jgi:hypothetical protein|uniref:Putative membrane protein n=1 Tax=Petrimonas mucosa TaxID=1642646 RepID=A0A1G4GB27_9BACT|nr:MULTISPECIES: NigD-like protein [Petrimonas]MDD3561227.1 NigD-like protein [Petrimonas mucosa]SCM59756.1 putative membrane protein {ECO:0000313/EMBL:CEA16754,1} [Petrimonas mucosa]SFU42407.1 NigD-like protein [Porphyromonadaceae bacterium KHP3R9]HHT30095.1 hypothetical protein [Petrimonas mucosa]
MNRTALRIAFVSILLSAVACNKKEDHSLGAFHIDIATVIPTGESGYRLLLDNGKQLWPVATDVYYLPSDDQRVFVNYTVLSGRQGNYDHYVKVNDIWNVLTKKIIGPATEHADSIGNDPIIINDAWIGNDYLNIDFLFNYGGVRPHAINLVTAPKPAASVPDTIELELRHNAFGSTSQRLYEGFVCFDLKPLQRADTDSVILALKAREGEETKRVDLVYRYNQMLVEARLTTPIPVVSSNEYY